MPEVHTLRAPENFNYNNDRRLTPVNTKNNQNSYGQKPEMYYLRSSNDKQTPSYDLLKPPSSPIYGNSNHRPSTVSKNKKRKSPISYQPLHGQKSEMYHLPTGGKKTPEYSRQSPSTNDTHQKPKLNGILTHPNSPSQKKVTTYMISGSDRENVLPYIPLTPSPVIRPNKKKQLVSFDTINHNDKYDILNKQRHFSTTIPYVPLSKSKATQSIQRSMNKYRFRRN